MDYICLQMNRFFALFICGALIISFPSFGQTSDEAVIKITGNEFDRLYKVFFASEIEFRTEVKLIHNNTGDVVIQDVLKSKGFLKRYSLKELPLGSYTWQVKYGFEEYIEEMELKPLKQLIKESISVSMDDLLNLTIEVKPYNTKPISLFFYDGSGEQLKYVFWEPKEGEYSMTFNLSEFDAYDVKLEILQEGDVQFTEVYSTY